MITDKKLRNIITDLIRKSLIGETVTAELKNIQKLLGADLLAMARIKNFNTESCFANREISLNEYLSDYIKELVREKSVSEINKNTEDEKSGKLLETFNVQKLFVFGSMNQVGSGACLLLGGEADYHPEPSRKQALEAFGNWLPLIYEAADSIKEKLVISEKKAEIKQKEKEDIESEYIRTCKNLDIYRKDKNRDTDRIQQLQEQEQAALEQVEELTRKNLELEEKHETLSDNVRQLQKKYNHLQSFIKYLSNEIRNSANKVVSVSEKMSFDNTCETAGERYAGQMNQASFDLLTVADNLSDLGQSEEEIRSVSKQQVDVNKLLEKIDENISSQPGKEKMRLSVKKIPEDKNRIIISDKEKLEKIMQIMMRCYAENRDAKYIRVLTDIRKNMLAITVESNVRCIAEAGHSGVLDQEYNAFDEISENNRNLSFYLLNQYIDLLDGTYSVGSAGARGTFLKVNLPFEEVVSEEESSELSETKSRQPEPAEKSKVEKQYGILIAEDEEINYMLLETLLTDVFQINPLLYHAENGREAVDLYKSRPERIDLILMDLKMPDMDGFTATQQIRRLKSNVPIIAQTAYNTKEYKIKAAQSGCNDLIAKPISRTIFRNILTKHLDIDL